MGRLRYTIFGAGAVGGVIAARLAGWNAVSVVARGAHLDAIRRHGLGLICMDGKRRSFEVGASESPADLAPADVVVVTLKAQSVAALASEIDAARKPDGLIVFLQNGLPWWLASDVGAFSKLDPKGGLKATFACCSAAIAYYGAAIASPGVVSQTAPGKVLIGSALGEPDTRIGNLAGSLSATGLEAAVTADIRQALWQKLQINVALNGIAALTRAPILDILDSAALRPLVLGLTAEVGEIAKAMGHDVSFDLDRQRQIIRPGQKSSTLQDIEAGKPSEFDALFGSVIELATRLDVPTPTLRTLVPLIGLAYRS